MELLNQRAKTNEKLQYPFAIYQDMINSHVVNASKNTDRIKQQQGMFIYPSFIVTNSQIRFLRQELKKSSEAFLKCLHEQGIYESMYAEYKQNNKMISIMKKYNQTNDLEYEVFERKMRHFLYKGTSINSRVVK